MGAVQSERRSKKVSNEADFFVSSGGRTRTSDLRVMSPTSYRLLYPAVWDCKGKDFFRKNKTFLKENPFTLLSSYDFTGFFGVYSTEFQCLILEPVNFFFVLNHLVFYEHGNA